MELSLADGATNEDRDLGDPSFVPRAPRAEEPMTIEEEVCARLDRRSVASRCCSLRSVDAGRRKSGDWGRRRLGASLVVVPLLPLLLGCRAPEATPAPDDARMSSDTSQPAEDVQESVVMGFVDDAEDWEVEWERIREDHLLRQSAGGFSFVLAYEVTLAEFDRTTYFMLNRNSTFDRCWYCGGFGPRELFCIQSLHAGLLEYRRYLLVDEVREKVVPLADRRAFDLDESTWLDVGGVLPGSAEVAWARRFKVSGHKSSLLARALVAHARRTGSFPEHLSDLDGSADPQRFCDGWDKPFEYRRDGVDAVVRSLGPIPEWEWTQTIQRLSLADALSGDPDQPSAR
jgi:hypothetical protein